MSLLPASLAPLEAVGRLVHFFSTRLLLKQYRRGVRAGSPQPDVAACERAFAALALAAVQEVTRGEALDAVQWVAECAAFSAEWVGLCHWLSPRKFRQLLTDMVGAAWAREEEIAAVSERPPMDMKWYRVAAGPDASRSLLCVVCSLVCNSMRQYTNHAAGKSHKVQALAWSHRNDGPVPGPLLLKAPLAQHEAPSLSSSTRTVSSDAGASDSSGSVASCPRACGGDMDAATRGLIARLDCLLARLPHGRAQTFTLAASLASSHAAEHALNAIVDAAVQADDVEPVAAIAAGVALGDRSFRTLLAAVVWRRAHPTGVSAAAAEAASCGFQGMYAWGDAGVDHAAAQLRARQDGLVRFAGALVRRGVLPASALVRSIEEALRDAPGAAVANACRVLLNSAVRARLHTEDERAARVVLRDALAARHHPQYVKAMAAPLVSADADADTQ